MTDLILAGRDEAVAIEEADFATRVITMQANAIVMPDGTKGMDPYDYFRSKNISIKGEMETKFGEQDVPSYYGGLMNLLRAGKGPTQKDIFGPSLIEFLISQGGVELDSEMSGRDLGKAMPDYAGRVLAKEGGISMESAYELARDAGYLPDIGEAAGEGDAVLALIDQELQGNRAYVPGLESQEDMDLSVALDHLEGMLRSKGIDLDQTTNAEAMDALGLHAFNQSTGRRLAQELTKWESVGDLNNLKTYEPLAAEAVESYLSRVTPEESERVRANLNEFAGTAWAASAVKGMVIREAMYQAWEGTNPEALLSLAMWGKRSLAAGGMGEALMRGKAGIELFATGYKFIGGNRKAEQDFSGSYVNCSPSLACATHCYAARGTSYNNSLMAVEFTEFMAEMNPELLADSIALQFEGSAPAQGGLALRINEKGELSLAQIDIVKRLNDKGIRIQIFSKRPELLAQTDATNLRMLSVDDTNLHLAEQNKDFDLAVVINDGFTQDWIKANADRVAVWLPVKLGNKQITHAELKVMYPDVYELMRRELCPVDSGKLDIPKKNTAYPSLQKGEWTCTSCDLYGSAGCFRGDRQTEVNQLEANKKEKPAQDNVMGEFLSSLEKLKESGAIDDARYSAILATIRDGESVNEGNPIGQTTTPDRQVPATRSQAHGEDKQGVIEVAEADLIPVRTLYQSVYHGAASPKPYENFSLKYINTGEGAQVYGWGMYFGGRLSTAKWYRDNMMRAKGRGRSNVNQSDWTDAEFEKLMNDIWADVRSTRWMDNTGGPWLDPSHAENYIEQYWDSNLDHFFDGTASDVVHDAFFNWLDDRSVYEKITKVVAIEDEFAEIRRNTFDTEKTNPEQHIKDLERIRILEDQADSIRQTVNIHISNAFNDASKRLPDVEESGVNPYTYQVDVPEDTHLLYYDTSLDKQPEFVRKAIRDAGVLSDEMAETLEVMTEEFDLLEGILGDLFNQHSATEIDASSPKIGDLMGRLSEEISGLMQFLNTDLDDLGRTAPSKDIKSWRTVEARAAAREMHTLAIDIQDEARKEAVKWYEKNPSGTPLLMEAVSDYARFVESRGRYFAAMIPATPLEILGGEPRILTVDEAESELNYYMPDGTEQVLIYPNELVITLDTEGDYIVDLPDDSFHSKNLSEVEAALAYDKEVFDSLFSFHGLSANVLPSKNEDQSGRSFYDSLSESPIVSDWAEANGLTNERADKIASLYLNSLGIPGLRYRDGNTRNKSGGYTYNYVIWNEDQINIEKAYTGTQRVMQAKGKTTAGYLDIGEGSYRITLTKNANLSTFIHEMGHLQLELIQADVLAGIAPPEMVEDFARITAYLEANAPGERVNGAFTTEQHELFARSLEAYFYEGRSPAPDMDGMFKRMKEWMKSVYSSLSKLDAPLSDEIRGVFDRMLAGDAAVESASGDVNPEMDYSSFDEVTQKRLEKLHAEATQAGLDEVQEQIRKDLAATKRKEYQARKKQLMVDVGDEIDQEPVYAVQNLIRNGEDKSRPTPDGIDGRRLNSADIVRAFGGDSSVLRRIVGLYQKDGVSPSALADHYGFGSTVSMIQEIIKAPARSKEIKTRVQAKLDEEFGNLKTDTEIFDQAALSVHNNKTSALLVAEANAATRKIGGQVKKTLAAEARLAAQNIISRMLVRDITAHKYYQAEQRAAKEAQIALSKDDTPAFLVAKRKQLLNHHLYREARKAVTEAEKARKYLDDKGKPRAMLWRKNDPDKARAIDTLLAALDFKKTSLKKIDLRNMLKGAVKQMEQEGEVVLIDPSLYAGDKNWKEMTLNELLDVRDQVKVWEKEGRLNDRYTEEFGSVGVEIIVEELDRVAGLNITAKKRKELLVEPNGRLDRLGRTIRDFGASLKKVEFNAREADGGIGGMWSKVIFQPFVDAQNARDTRLNAVDVRVKEIMGDMTKEDAVRLFSKRTFMGFDNVTVGDLYVVALNMGNEGNLNRLLNGYSWDYATLMEELQEHLTLEDFYRIEALGQLTDSFYPELARVSEKVDGVIPPKVESRPLYLNKYGVTLSGWYYPVKYKDVAGTPEKQATAEFKTVEMGPSPMTGQVSKSMTQSRALGTPQGKIDLSFSNFGSHINQTIHYITHYEAVRRFDKLRLRTDFAEMYTKYFGEAGRKQLRSWVQNIATDGRVSSTSHAATNTWNDIHSHVRAGYSMVALGWDIVGAVKQTLGIASTAAEVGATRTARVLLGFVAEAGTFRRDHPGSMYQTALDNSPELRNMSLQLDRDIREISKGNLSNVSVSRPGVGKVIDGWDFLKANSFQFIVFVQKQVNAITWLAAHDKAVAEGLVGKEATNYADAVVRQSQSGGGLKDLAGIQQAEGELVKASTMFITWGIVVYNHLEMTGRQDLLRGFIRGEGPNSRAKSMMRFANTFGWYVLASSLLDQVVFGDDEENEEEFMLTYLKNVIGTSTFGIPLVRDAVSAASGFDVNSPYAKLFGSAKRALTTEDLTSSAAYNIASSLTVVTHLPFRAVLEVVDALTQEEWSDKIESLLTGVPYEERLEGLD